MIIMKSEKPLSYVESISDSEITVVCGDKTAEKQVQSIGGKQTFLPPRKWKVHYTSEDQLASLLATLRDVQVAMAGSLSGWPPAAVFEQLRDKGKIAGGFTEIMWSKPDKEVFFER